MNNNIKYALNATLAFSLISAQSIATADDTQAFLVNNSKPNLLFVMDMSESMKWGIDASGYNSETGQIDEGSPPSRSDIMKDAVKSVLDAAPDNIDIGLMSYGPGTFGESSRLSWPENYRSHGVHGIAFPAKGIDKLAWPIISASANIDNLPNPSSTTTVRQYLSDIVNTWEPKGGTPIVDSLVEASRYFAGDKVVFGQDIPSSARGAHPSSYQGNAITSSLINSPRDPDTAPNYESPITDSCQTNYIALLSDGEPNNYYLSQTEIVRDGDNYYRVATADWGKGPGPFASYMKGNVSYGTLAMGVGDCVDAPSGFRAGQCGPEAAQYMSTHDMNQAVAGEQNIKVFTVGYGNNLGDNTQNFLKSLVTIEDKPGTPEKEGYYSATNAELLNKAFVDIINEVTKSASTLGSPSYSVNVQSGLEHDDETYVPLFSPDSGVRWSGNLKKFKLVNSTQGDNQVKVLQGKNNQVAFDEQGQFKEEALDYWSTSPSSTPDGGDLSKGGVASRLNPNTRKLFTDLTCGASACSLNVEGNLLISSNDQLTNALLEIDSDEDPDSGAASRELLINFIRGKNPDGTTRYHMGDMLHSDPTVITYSEATDSSAKKQYIFVGTNEGYLHAFDSATGEEEFAFMPKELLKNIAPQYYNLDGPHLYGVDGKISHWYDRANNKRYLYFGLRRGGTAFYALDITDIKSPKLLWKKSAADHPTMGQSWSAPYLDRVGVSEEGTKKEAVIISTGYDVTEDRKDATGALKNDDPTNNVDINVGNDILVLDAKTGQKLWSLSDTEDRSKITNSIPGGIRVLDTNFNGLVDRIYFADTGGNVWRLDLSETIGSDTEQSTLTKLASLAGTGVNARKFYSIPEIAALKHKGKTLYTISIGSGYRVHPLNSVIDDKFFILIDDSPLKTLDEGFSAITTTDLAHIDIVESASDAALTTTGKFYENGKLGWMISLPQTGEKVLTKAITRNGAVIFTTFVPNGDPSTCGGSISRLYAINILTGKAGINFADPQPHQTLDKSTFDGSDGSSPRMPGAGYPGIAPPPELVFGSFEIDEDGNCKHPVDYRWGRKSSPVSGYSACSLESAYWSDPVTN